MSSDFFISTTNGGKACGGKAVGMVCMTKLAGYLFFVCLCRVRHTHRPHTDNFPAPYTEGLSEESLKELEEMGLSTARITGSTAQDFSEVVNTCFLAPLQKIGVRNFSTAANLCPRNDNNVLGRMIGRNHKDCFFFISVLIHNKKLSLLNHCNKAKINSTLGFPKMYNHTFWRYSLDI